MYDLWIPSESLATHAVATTRYRGTAAGILHFCDRFMDDAGSSVPYRSASLEPDDHHVERRRDKYSTVDRAGFRDDLEERNTKLRFPSGAFLGRANYPRGATST